MEVDLKPGKLLENPRKREWKEEIAASLLTHPAGCPSESAPRHFRTQWKGSIVPMNDHSDKEAVLYTCPTTNRDYRFILHRKNHQKADNYACARCKSRKKYVRILISGEYFLEDPASLEHICYLDADELKRARENSEKLKSLELIKERQRLVKRQRALVKNDELLDLASIPHETPIFAVNTIARLFEDTSGSADIHPVSPCLSATGDEEEPEQDPSAASSLLDTLFNSTINAQHNHPTIKTEPVTDERPEVSDPELKEPTVIKRPRSESFAVCPSPETNDGSFQISLNRALSGLRQETRALAENEILRFVYSKLYEKYGPQ